MLAKVRTLNDAVSEDAARSDDPRFSAITSGRTRGQIKRARAATVPPCLKERVEEGRPLPALTFTEAYNRNRQADRTEVLKCVIRSIKEEEFRVLMELMG